MDSPRMVRRRYIVDVREDSCEYESMTELTWFEDGSLSVQVVVLQPGIW